MRSENEKNYPLRLPNSLYKEASELAKNQNRSFNSLAVEAITTYVSTESTITLSSNTYASAASNAFDGLIRSTLNSNLSSSTLEIINQLGGKEEEDESL